MRRGWVGHSAGTAQHGRGECTSMIRKRSPQAGREQDWRRLSPAVRYLRRANSAYPESTHDSQAGAVGILEGQQGEAFQFQTVTAR